MISKLPAKLTSRSSAHIHRMQTENEDKKEFTGVATILSFGHSNIGSAVGKRPIEHGIATSEWPTEY